MTPRKVNIMKGTDAIILRKLIEEGTGQYVAVKLKDSQIMIWIHDYEGEHIFATISEQDYDEKFKSDPQNIATHMIECYRDHKGYK